MVSDWSGLYTAEFGALPSIRNNGAFPEISFKFWMTCREKVLGCLTSIRVNRALSFRVKGELYTHVSFPA
jgi:hypothetical protein